MLDIFAINLFLKIKKKLFYVKERKLYAIFSVVNAKKKLN